jgi:hypothetical protein
MRDRIGALDGRLSIVSAPGRGTVVSGSVALAAATGEGDAVSARRQVGTLRLGDDQ